VNGIPTLARGCRLGAEQTLLMPEGLLKLSQTAARVLALCDGKRSIEEIVETLCAEFPVEQHARIRSDVLGFVEKLVLKKALELR
jgi:pyrroloquinoline quinone biosynthesis protein D